ncbi:DeoR/GlpR family DNA-binding transcription regulator [Brevibacillus laterosporus]|uniref:DeoR/GlpR family DNA-binding transcription regulator n=1 Tax=Brevibacillus laterosporus TaxID=1465 RepID=A0AAP3G721_BRELA|nr:DeoR/GlpR family DNA-binding transcription regulator [Brevibacillus laterosporus]MBG9797188.1 DeoR family transcriptional regulator [Brevibacillus laterosporus]MCR8937239.1 DeoR/GlpR family DNA-binding transcription regulator [Brevibacillus laterosporus]MCR8979893.1 DeoR/GlpR family DNA-binding transcription regulator [Brevibacillus laterosporus]MCZ0807048.1 DeoR/GlpR family DNA-binding transcription regulator [Brevibacillus laterosporus]MCZ0826482.1 DeoR/GlpR family DNA-binding transcripti
MLTPERHQLILALLKEKEVVTVHELVDTTNASESTIRRDLSELEEKRYLKRVHGGASILHRKLEEPTVLEKVKKSEQEKVAIAAYAASLIKDKDSIYLDAGTTTEQMIPHITAKQIVIVTNGLNIALTARQYDCKTILIGGEVKAGTMAVIGRGAATGMGQYRFDKCFLGMNAFDLTHGFTTPDPEEAYIKQLALSYSDEKYVLCDSQKYGEVTFAKVADINEAMIITDDRINPAEAEKVRKLTRCKVVKL